MSDQKSSAMIYPRLCIAYFLQFVIWGSWAMTIGGYADRVLKLDVGLIYTAIPLAAVAALFVGPIVDRMFAAQKVLAILHLIGGVCLICCGFQTSFILLFTFMLLHGICYMPSIALLNSIVFRHIPDSNNAPRVFVFGTLGWIIVNLIIDVFGKGASAPNFFFIGGGAAILLGIYSLTLPNTPPVAVKGEKGGSMFDALKLFADPAFVIFAVCVVAASIPACGFYFPMAVPLFTECDFPSPVALTTLNQFSELIFMLALPFFAVRIGLKKCLLLGMAAWGLRYVFFMQLSFTFALLALFLHGFCYSFLYVASYMYADKKAPPALKASAQSLMAFLLLGVGQVAGSLLFSYQVNNNPAAFPEMQVAAAGKAISLPVWKDTNLQDSAWRYLNLSETVNSMLGQKGKPFTDLGVLDTNRDNVITWSELETIPESGFAYGEEGKTLTITKGELQDAFRKIAAINAKDKAAIVDTDIQVSRDQWLAVQMKNWKGILFSPIIIVAVCFLAFLVLGKDPVEAVAGKK